MSRSVEEELQLIVEDLKNGYKPQRKVRTLLRYFGYKGRGEQVCQTIQERLSLYNLQTDPDFRLPPMDNRVRFLFANQPVTGDPVIDELDSESNEEGSQSTELVEVHETNTTVQASTSNDEDDSDSSSNDKLLEPPLRIYEEPTYRVSRLEAANRMPVMIAPDQPIEYAAHRMLEHDYSQLPVGSGPRGLKGIVTLKTIVRHLHMPKERHCKVVSDCMDKNVCFVRWDDGLFQAVTLVRQYGYAVVRDNTEKVCGILTADDVVGQFETVARPFMYIEEIEGHLRNLVGSLALDRLRAVRREGVDGPVIEGPENLFFSEYVPLLADDENWREIGLQLDRKRLLKQIEQTREIRNKVMHFNPEGIDVEDMAHLRTLAKFLSEIDRARYG